MLNRRYRKVHGEMLPLTTDLHEQPFWNTNIFLIEICVSENRMERCYLLPLISINDSSATLLYTCLWLHLSNFYIKIDHWSPWFTTDLHEHFAKTDLTFVQIFTFLKNWPVSWFYEIMRYVYGENSSLQWRSVVKSNIYIFKKLVSLVVLRNHAVGFMERICNSDGDQW